MKFKGTFTTVNSYLKYNVEIGTGTECIITDVINLEEDREESLGPVVMFDSTPVTITCDREDLTKRIIISQCQINLISQGDLSPWLYAQDNQSVPVTITRIVGSNQQVVWFGYVDPLQFSQGYAHNYEGIQVTATDPLGRLNDIKVDEIIIYGSVNNEHISKSTEISPYNLILSILNTIGITNLNRQIPTAVYNALTNTKIKMTVFFGDDKDDYKTAYEVLENICNYFNLYIGMHVLNECKLYCGTNDSSSVDHNIEYLEPISLYRSVTDDSTSISQDDIYSQIKVKCNIEPVKDIFTALDDKDYTYSDYNNYVKYMTEWESPNESANSWKDFNLILNDHEDQVTWDDVWSVDHYVYALRNDMWDFGSNSYIDYLGGSITYNNDNTVTKTQCTVGQMNVMNWLHEAPFRCAYVGLAKSNKVQPSGKTKDNSVQDNITLKKYLVISTLGDYDNSNTSLQRYRTLLQNLNSNPLCKFRGYDNNIVSPTDSKVTNYIVISGNVILNPLPQLCGQHWNDDKDRTLNTWNDAKTLYQWNNDNHSVLSMGGYHKSVRADGTDWCYYQQRWMWDNNGTIGYNDNILGVYGPLDRKCQYAFKYEYSEGGVAYDKITKMPIICCQLKVGDKYCVERLDLSKEEGGGPNVFQWMTLAECQAIHFSDPDAPGGYVTLSPTFTIGIDPKIDDIIIGPSYQIAKSSTLQMNIDKSGMVIPVKASDKLSGTVEFSILGPYNTVWNEVCKYYHGWWFWEYSFYESHKKSILANTQSIMLEGLKIELTSDNAGINDLKTTADNDLIYASNMNSTYNEDQELEIDICTTPSFDECQAWGIKYQTSNSYILNSDNTPFRGYNGNTKPEECLIDYLYKEYGAPSKILETQLKSTAFIDGTLGNQMIEEMLDTGFENIFQKTNPSDPDIYARLMSYESDLKHMNMNVKFREYKTILDAQI